jgi:hypothetical protein
MTTGGVAPPALFTKIKICERMHWTFAEYDATDAIELQAALAIWSLEGRP